MTPLMIFTMSCAGGFVGAFFGGMAYTAWTFRATSHCPPEAGRVIGGE